MAMNGPNPLPTSNLQPPTSNLQPPTSNLQPPTSNLRMINDAHIHFFSSRFLELLAPDAGGAEAIASRLGWDAPGTATELGDRWVIELDRNGVSRAALIASIPGDAASVAEAVAHHPDRLVGFFMHNPAAQGADATLARA